MTDQAVNVGAIFKVKILIRPPIAGVAGRATFPVALNTDAEIIDGVLFSGGEHAFSSFYFHRI